MTLNYVSLLIEQQDAGQDAGSGAVVITPTSKVTAGGVTVVSQVPVTRQLSSGSVTVQLVACDNAGITPAPGFWAYSILLPGDLAPTLYLVNFAAGSSQRLDQLSEVIAQTTYGPAAAAGVTTFNGRSGAVTPQSSDYSPFFDAAGAASAALASAEAYALARAGQAMTGFLAPGVVTLTDAATVAVNAAAANELDLTMTTGVGSTRAIGVPSNPVNGQRLTFRLRQPASGGPCSVTWASGTGGYGFGSGTAPTLSTGASACDVAAFDYDATKQQWMYLGSALGF